MIFKNLVYLSCLFMINNCVAILPPDVPLCKPEDVVCISKVSTELIRNNPKGRSDIGIVQLDPFHVNSLEINQGNNKGPITLDFTFKDLDVEGLSQATIERSVGFSKDPKTSKFEMYGSIPQLSLKGKYKTGGRILLLPIQGEGNAEVILKNVKSSVKFKPKVMEKDGKIFLDVEKMKVLLEPEVMTVQLEGLFNGDPALGKQMNKFLNENWKDVWTELGPSINDAVAEVIKSIMTPLYKKHAYNEVFLQ